MLFSDGAVPYIMAWVTALKYGVMAATAYGFMNTIGVAMGALCTMILGSMKDSGHLGLAFALLGLVTALALIVQLTVLRPTTDDKQ